MCYLFYCNFFVVSHPKSLRVEQHTRLINFFIYSRKFKWLPNSLWDFGLQIIIIILSLRIFVYFYMCYKHMGYQQGQSLWLPWQEMKMHIPFKKITLECLAYWKNHAWNHLDELPRARPFADHLVQWWLSFWYRGPKACTWTPQMQCERPRAWPPPPVHACACPPLPHMCGRDRKTSWRAGGACAYAADPSRT